MKRKILNSIALLIVSAVLAGCVSTSGCYGSEGQEICAKVNSFMRPLQQVSYTRTAEGLEVNIVYSKEQVSLQAAADLLRAAGGQ